MPDSLHPRDLPPRRSGRGTKKAAAGAPRRSATAASGIHRFLRDEIVSLRRRPGESIVEKQVAEAYGVSRTPVREALLKLADEGLVEVFPQSGTFVARIPVDALPEAGAIRKALELATVRRAAERATRSQIANLQACLVHQHEVELARDANAFHQADETFHAMLADVAGYPGFWTMVQQVKVQVDRCRRLTLPSPGRMGKVIAEHEAVVEAIAAHDPNRAILALDLHLDGLLVSIDDIRSAYPHFFSGAPDERLPH
ncbi:GntR family transcriptional regulator [Azospirillum rugosum]|uniref:DNA-binding GntR family transcriptional regulator n=1 Tax=Azospirillum rugosum TaxID=416170 RepID=A0ABS4SX83_9PROT|nr:GntR family transcriptional regulator [Azospirillum rugosum]MBP2297167.1 DNA-binding GntR family transcriptional regulator [Azospirillum rugosum]MDQ0530593.1 DNA-binding GntR family transcriptional regulator [Azospirillum rugosum]